MRRRRNVAAPAVRAAPKLGEGGSERATATECRDYNPSNASMRPVRPFSARYE